MNKRLGVIVGRFQLADLHAGHRHIIDTAIRENQKVLVFVGIHGGQPTNRNPLDFESRKAMLVGSYPNLLVLPLDDARSDQYWSDQLDRLIQAHVPGHQTTLYGSRDSFLAEYCGSHETRFVEALPTINATQLRQSKIAVVDDTFFRQGVIHATVAQRFPTAYPVIDVAIRHSVEEKILLGRKADEDRWRFVGGFVDPTDESLESAARREVREEVGDIEVADVTYLGSCRIDDQRYRNSVDGVISSFFLATYIFGAPRAADDLAEVRWFSIENIEDHIIASHKPLTALLKSAFGEKS